MPRAKARKARAARRIKNATTKAAKAAARAKIDPTTGAAVGAAAAQIPTEGNWLAQLMGKGKGMLNTPEVARDLKLGIGYLLLEGLLSGAMEGVQGQQQGNLAQGMLQAQGRAFTPEASTQRALSPVLEAQRNSALMMLMQAMGGGGEGMPSMLAEGEVYT